MDPREAKVFRAHSASQDMCDNLINTLRHLTNQQRDGDSLAELVVADLLEESRRGIEDGLRKIIAVDNHEAVKVGDLHRNTKSSTVMKPKFTTDIPGAVIGNVADTLRAHEEGLLRTLIDTSMIKDQRWEMSAGGRGLSFFVGFFPGH